MTLSRESLLRLQRAVRGHEISMGDALAEEDDDWVCDLVSDWWELCSPETALKLIKMALRQAHNNRGVQG